MRDCDVIVDADGTVKVPRDITEQLKLRPGDLLQFMVLDGGTVVLRPRNGSITDLAGWLHREGQATVAIEDMSP
ncbi:AbrB/MazE/SpoVT family DNA-binding domain-containing protein [Oxalobacteraceae bacterium A2-2]